MVACEIGKIAHTKNKAQVTGTNALLGWNTLSHQGS